MCALPFPFGLSLTTTTTQPPDRREFLNAQNNIENARAIDPLSRDYVLSTNGGYAGMDAMQQQVYLASITITNTAIVKTFGNPLFNIKLLTPNTLNQVQGAVQNALSSLISSGNITLNSVGISTQPNGILAININWTNNITYNATTTVIPLG